MSTFLPSKSSDCTTAEETRLRQCALRVPAQHGIVLVIAMIMLIIVSLLAVTTMRNASSSEGISGNVRTTELATQAAEIALRHCESSAVRIAKINSGDTTSPQATYPTTFTSAYIAPISTNTWQTTANWDSASTYLFVLPASLVDGTTTYRRPPECIVEWLNSATAPPTAFLVTARGFGPEVASGTGRPVGSTVWLQSTIELQ